MVTRPSGFRGRDAVPKNMSSSSGRPREQALGSTAILVRFDPLQCKALFGNLETSVGGFAPLATRESSVRKLSRRTPHVPVPTAPGSPACRLHHTWHRPQVSSFAASTSNDRPDLARHARTSFPNMSEVLSRELAQLLVVEDGDSQPGTSSVRGAGLFFRTSSDQELDFCEEVVTPRERWPESSCAEAIYRLPTKYRGFLRHRVPRL